jgi:hypothetical protein
VGEKQHAAELSKWPLNDPNPQSLTDAELGDSAFLGIKIPVQAKCKADPLMRRPRRAVPVIFP